MDLDTRDGDGPLSRRRFLVGAAVLASTLAVGRGTAVASTPSPLARLAASDGPRLSVGYLPGLFGAQGLPAGHRVVPVTQLRRSRELSSAAPARVRLTGLTAGGNGLSDSMHGVDLDVLLPPRDRAATAPLSFYAWTLRTGRHGGRSNTTSFVAGLKEDPALGFTLSVHRTGQEGLDVHQASIFLSLAGRHGAAVLRPGTYLLGVEPAPWDVPVRLPAVDDEGAWQALLSLVVTVQPAR